MTDLDISVLVIIIGLVVSSCSIAAFFLGRKKEATAEGNKSGIIESNVKSIFCQLTEIKTSFDRMSLKMDQMDEKRESEYRNMLVGMTELSASYKSLHKRVDAIEHKIEFITER